MLNIIDLTLLEEKSIEDLLKYKTDVTEMYNRSLAKKNIGAANVLYVVKCMLNDEIRSRENPKKS